MKRKMIGAVVAAVVLMAFFAACDNGAQDVKSVGQIQPDAPASVSAVQSKDKYAVILTWDAVKDGTSYSVYYQIDGKKTIGQLSNGQNQYTYNPADGTNQADDGKTLYNTDVDKWSASLTIDPDYKIGGTVIKSTTRYLGKVKFGVRANAYIPGTGWGTGNSSSDITWSAPIDVTAPVVEN